MLEKQYFPLYGDLDPDYSVGLRGYLSWFQNIATEYNNIRDLGNDVLPEKYGLFWVYAGYRFHIERKAKIAEPLTLRLWSSDAAPADWLWQEFTVRSGRELLAAGRLDSCLMDKESGHRCRKPPFPIPRDIGVTLPFALPELNFSKEKPQAPCFQHVIRFADLDASLHLNNLNGVNMVLSAFSAAELKDRAPMDFAIRYLSQCYEHQNVTVHRVDGPDGTELAIVRPDDIVAGRARFRWGAAEKS